MRSMTFNSRRWRPRISFILWLPPERCSFPDKIIAAEYPDEKQSDTCAALCASHPHFLASSAAVLTKITP